MKQARTRRKANGDLVLPPHANAETHKKIMQQLAKMTPDEIFQTLVESGIYTKSGRLRKPYAPQPDDQA